MNVCVSLLKDSFDANKTHDCSLKMSIIALFLHISWDRKCQVTDSRFRSGDSGSFAAFQRSQIQTPPQFPQKRGAAHPGAVWVRVHTYSRRMHTARYARRTLAYLCGTTDTPSVHKTPTPSPNCARPSQVHCWFTLNMTHRTPKMTLWLPTDMVTNVWAHTGAWLVELGDCSATEPPAGKGDPQVQPNLVDVCANGRRWGATRSVLLSVPARRANKMQKK